VMNGRSRRQVLSPDGLFLYTLYSRVDGDDPYGFVHVLMLSGGLVHCVDLPPELGTADGGAVAISPDGSRLYVLGAGGSLAEIDTTEPFRAYPFPVVARVDLPRPEAVSSDAVALTVDADRVWAGIGHEVVAIEREGLRISGQFTVGGPVGALAASGQDTLVVAAGDSLDVLDTATGAYDQVATLDGAVERLTIQG
jgi:hypothetical protein